MGKQITQFFEDIIIAMGFVIFGACAIFSSFQMYLFIIGE